MLKNAFVGGLAVALGVLSLSFESNAHGFGGPKAFPVPQQSRSVLGQLFPGVAGSVGGALNAAASLPKHLLGGPMLGGLGRNPRRQHGGSRRHGPGHWADWNLYRDPVNTYDQNQCENDWKVAILGVTMNYNNWQCSARLTSTGTTENCVLTGLYPAPVTTTPAAPITAQCKWTVPLFCDNFVNDVVNSLLKSKIPVGVSPPLPPTGYTSVAGAGFFKVHTTAKTWANAQTTCVSEGGNLAVPSRPGDYAALAGLMAATSPATTEAYIGFTDVLLEGNFVAVTGQPSCQLAQIPFVAPQPDNASTNEHCLQILNPTATVNDIDCSLALPFICEITDASRTPCPL